MTWLHPYARFVCAATLLLITAGGMVTSTGSGLAVPDWPNTYGYFMFSFPLSKMVGGIFYEHGHRLIASIVGLLTVGLTVWLWRAEPRRWIRRLGVAALAAVILQGLLGGLTVLYFLPTPISVSHAGLAQIFFCLTVCLALFTSAGWHRSGSLDTHEPVGRDSTLLALATGLPLLVYAQILVGATMSSLVLNLALNYWLIPLFRESGAALASAISYSVLYAMVWFGTWRTNSLRARDYFLPNSDDLLAVRVALERRKGSGV